MTFYQTDRGAYSAWVEKLACTNQGELLLASVIGDQQILRGMAAALNNNGGTMEIKTEKFRVTLGDASAEPSALHRSKDVTYECRFVKLPYGKAHGMFISRSAGFMPAITEPHLWQDLTSPRFSTPLLREWMPYVTAQLQERKLLIPVPGFRCECARLVATGDDLDTIISQGVIDGKLQIGSYKHGEIERMAG
jgi:hypothetical protein